MANNYDGNIFCSQPPSPKMPITPQKASPLLSLPAELRLHIYELVALSEPEIQLHVGWINQKTTPGLTTGSHSLRYENLPTSALALLISCKQTYAEAHDLVWDHLRFHLRIYAYRPYAHPIDDLSQYIAGADVPALLGRMRAVKISFGGFSLMFNRPQLMAAKLEDSAFLRTCVLHYASGRDSLGSGEFVREWVDGHFGGLIRRVKARAGSIVLESVGGCKGTTTVFEL